MCYIIDRKGDTNVQVNTKVPKEAVEAVNAEHRWIPMQEPATKPSIRIYSNIEELPADGK